MFSPTVDTDTRTAIRVAKSGKWAKEVKISAKTTKKKMFYGHDRPKFSVLGELLVILRFLCLKNETSASSPFAQF